VDKTLRKSVNCVEDERQNRSAARWHGDVSPWRLLSTTIYGRAEIIFSKKIKSNWSLSKGSRCSSAAGHMADAAYWYDGNTGKFITSTYYLNALPTWVENFNARKLSDEYLSKEWNTYFPISQYTESGPDDSPYEQRWIGMDKNVFRTT